MNIGTSKTRYTIEPLESPVELARRRLLVAAESGRTKTRPVAVVIRRD